MPNKASQSLQVAAFLLVMQGCSTDLSTNYKSASIPNVKRQIPSDATAKEMHEKESKAEDVASAMVDSPIQPPAPTATASPAVESPSVTPTVVSTPTKAETPNAPFWACVGSSLDQPISAKVYQLPSGTPSIVKATLNETNLKAKICMNKFNVAPRSFTEGFPNLPELFEWFGLDARAKLIVPVSGTYTFKLLSDDGAVLYLNNQVVINHDGLHVPSIKTGRIDLPMGAHDLRILYYQGPAQHIALQLFWTPPDKSEEIIPTSAFQPVSF